jgi:hypothetical protein
MHIECAKTDPIRGRDGRRGGRQCEEPNGAFLGGSALLDWRPIIRGYRTDDRWADPELVQNIFRGRSGRPGGPGSPTRRTHLGDGDALENSKRPLFIAVWLDDNEQGEDNESGEPHEQRRA